MDELVLYLRVLRGRAGLSVSQLHGRLTEMVRSSDPLGDPPGLSTLHRRLGGENLHNAARMVDSVVEICVRVGEMDAGPVRERVLALRLRAREEMARNDTAAASDRASAPEDRDRRLAAVTRRLSEVLQENQRLAAEAAASRELISALIAGRAEADPADEAVYDQLRAEVGELAKTAQQALAEARSARAEVAILQASGVPDSQGIASRGGRNSSPRPLVGGTADRASDADLDRLVALLERVDPEGARMAAVIEGARTYLFDGERTGRYAWGQLLRGEKTMFGTIVSRLAHKEFELDDGARNVLAAGGIDFDLRYSQALHWMFPPEAVGDLVVVVHSDEETGRFGYGVLRLEEDLLTVGANRDGKRTLTVEGRQAIRWIHEDAPFETSVLLGLAEEDRNAILGQTQAKARLSELFRRIQGIPVSRNDVVTVAQQADATRRLRDSRELLAADGIVLFDSHRHTSILRSLGTPTPARGRWVSMRLAPADSAVEGPAVRLDGTFWRRAHSDDPVTPLPSARFPLEAG
jgi:hypothetical protein